MALEEIKRALGLEIYQALQARPDKDPRRDPEAGEKLWIAAAGPMVDYLYLSSGSSVQGLHWVTTIGNTTTNDIIVANLKSDGNVYINYGGADADSYLYFYENSSATGAFLKWDDDPGEFVLSHQLSMSTHKIVDVVDPTSAQDVVTLNHLAGVISGSAGSVDTLDDVCDRGNTTDQSITAANLKSNSNVYINNAGGEGDSFVYFYEGGSETGRYLKWDDTNNRFYMHDAVEVSGSAYLYGHCYVNFNGPDASSYFYFYENSNVEGAFFGWNDTDSRFAASHDLCLGANKLQFTDADAYWQYTAGVMKTGKGVWTLANIIADGNVNINYSGGDADSYLYFYEGGSATGRSLKWDDTNNRFYMNDSLYVSHDLVAGNDLYLNFDASNSNADIYFYKPSSGYETFQYNKDIGYFYMSDTLNVAGSLYINGHVYINFDGPDAASFFYFYENSNPEGAFFGWNDTETRFVSSHTFATNVDLKAASNIYVNFNGGDADSFLYFYEGGSETGAYLKWDDSPASFVMNKGLKVGDGGSTNYCEIKDDGEINLHGTARVNGHVRVSARSWGKGASAPEEGLVGVVQTLDFDAASDDEAHYTLLCPYRMAAGATINVEADWCYTGTQDNGTVCWGVEYINLPSGSAVAGATTTITGTSPTHQMVNRMVRTQLDAGITGVVAHDVIGLRLYRDVSEDTLAADARLMQVHFHFVMDKLGQAT